MKLQGKEKNSIVILGASGMLGHKLFQIFSGNRAYDVHGTVRRKAGLPPFLAMSSNIHEGVEASQFETIERILDEIAPDIVINCIGVIKQSPLASDPISSISINSLLPHVIAQKCKAIGARMVHISTDCVFSGIRGMYTEESPSDADDLYGKSKYLGEVRESHCVTIRTSIIGHELKTRYGLIEWFLSQTGRVRGFSKAIFTGFPTVEIARIVSDYVIPTTAINGLVQISADPISKYDLLKLVAQIYCKKLEIDSNESLQIDRSLDSSLFRNISGYSPPDWHRLVCAMHEDYQLSRSNYVQG